MSHGDGPAFSALQQLRTGRISRREFGLRAAALGLDLSLIAAALNVHQPSGIAAQEPPATRPTVGTDLQSRGEGGELVVLQWFPAAHAFAHVYADLVSAANVSSMVLEPLLSFASDGSLVPNLAIEVPSKANGGLSDDLSTVTLRLREDVHWSDGQPFTSADVAWTWRWVTDERNGAFTSYLWQAIQEVEVVDDATIQLIYEKGTLAWFLPLAGGYNGAIIPAHVWRDQDVDAVNTAFLTNPIGTGPYRIESFGPDDQIVCTINDFYREPNKPFFSRVRILGGGDPVTTAQRVIQTGDSDVAEFVFAAPEVLKELTAGGDKGRIESTPPIGVERLAFNFSDPHRELEGERSNLDAPHPFLTEYSVRRAMSLAIDRERIHHEILADVPYWSTTRNVLTGIAALESPNTTFAYDVDRANELLDEAGWKLQGLVRAREGVILKVSYATSFSGLGQFKRYRQKTQEFVQQAWESIGIEVELEQLTGEVYFDVSPENQESYAHFFRDVEMFSSGPLSPFPDVYFQEWYAGPGNANVAQKSNGWNGLNIQRYVNPRFDALFEEATTTTDIERAVDLFIQMNDLIVEDYVVIPLFAQGTETALSNRLASENIALSDWEPVYWNIANWRTTVG